MAILFAGTSVADLGFVGAAAVSTTSAALAANVAEGFGTTNTIANAIGPKLPPKTEFWHSQYLIPGSTAFTNGSVVFKWLDPAGADTLRVIAYATGPAIRLQRKNAASTWADMADGVFVLGNTLLRIDIHIKLHASSGIFKLFVNGVACIDFTGNTMPFAASAISYFGIGATYGFNTATHSAIIVADEDTRPMTFVQRLPTGTGAATDWSNSYTAIDETGYSDADFVAADTVGDTSTYTFADLPSGMETKNIAAVVLAGRARNSGGIAEIKGVARISSTNYEEEGTVLPSPLFAPQQWIMPLNPATSAAWLGSDYNAAEFGVKAA